jgi:hypothetical protein
MPKVTGLPAPSATAVEKIVKIWFSLMAPGRYPLQRYI